MKEVRMRRKPELDLGFVPLGLWMREYLREAETPFSIAVEREDGQVAVHETFVRAGAEDAEATRYFAERTLKNLLWQKGGFRVYLKGPRDVCESLRRSFARGGAREFDAEFMGGIYRRPFSAVLTEGLPPASERPGTAGWHTEGCRIGLDIGGSDRKVSAVMDGEVLFSEETVWQPKAQTDPAYHWEGIVDSLRKAAAALPRVDAVGVSSAGIFSASRTLYAQLFGKVPQELFDETIKDIFPKAIREVCGDVPFSVANDGDITALTGAIALGRTNLLGIALGTSEAAGFIDREGRITGWLNELAFAPVCAAAPGAPVDSWSGDAGCGVSYLSQEAAIRLAPGAGIALREEDPPGARLKHIQDLLAAGGAEAGAARKVFRSIGCHLGHIAAWYHDMYGADSILLLGRVMSGEGGEHILSEAKQALAEDYPELALEILLPDEKMRRLGQSVTAAYLPPLRAEG